MKIDIEYESHLYIDGGHITLDLFFGESHEPSSTNRVSLEEILKDDIGSRVIPSPEGGQIRKKDRQELMRSLKKLRKQIDSAEKHLLSIKEWDKNDW